MKEWHKTESTAAWNPVVDIEIVNYCNARCSFCPTGNGKLKSKVYMSPQLFEAVIEHLLGNGFLSGNNNQVLLFNYGEPFLHPQIDHLMKILKKNKLKAGFSSNFIKLPSISPAHLGAVGTLIFSLSGMSHETYRVIHGGDIDSVLANFERFFMELNSTNPDAEVLVFWHRYRFNEYELETARSYFKQKNVVFRPCLAYLIDLEKNIEIIEAGGVKSAEGKQLNRKMFLEEIYAILASLSGPATGNDFECLQHNILAINEYGDLLTCCGLTRFHKEYKIGNVLEMNAAEMYRAKRKASICRKCLRYGIPQYMQYDVDHLQQLIDESKGLN